RALFRGAEGWLLWVGGGRVPGHPRPHRRGAGAGGDRRVPAALRRRGGLRRAGGFGLRTRPAVVPWLLRQGSHPPHPSTGERCVRVLPPGGGLSADRGTASPCMPALPLRAVARRAVEPAGGTSREHRGGACAGRRVPGGGGGHVDGGGSGGDAHHPGRGGDARSPAPRGGALSRTGASAALES